ncbi:alpha/beta hydrolase fold domain-containing protein [Mycolicibacterium sp. CR10]|uniref:alpha/beta hydrolase fold domain-containing protein n=1 Tax=Mycolicibacterium sp. CR10 TaxID=2562314 RepID=UPI001F0D6CD2|nr:alpha/beta hydrolase [Mycolicibacterium sp. CR10]
MAGVGAAIFTGWGCAVASAEDGSGASQSGATTQRDAGPSKNAGDAGPRVERHEDDADDDDVENAREDAVDSDDVDDDAGAEDVDADDVEADAEDVDADDVDADAEDVDAEEKPLRRDADDETVEPAAGVSPTTVQTELDPPDVADDPNTPPAPAAAPGLWTLMGAARRETEHAATPLQTASVQTTGETIEAATGITYTAAPTFFDQVVVGSLRVMSGISKLIGVDIYGLFAKALESDRPPWFMTSGLDARKTQYEVEPGNVWQVWEFHPPNPTGKTVVAVHGGGFVVQPLATHWSDYTAMARSTGATVIVPMYPLATTDAGTATKVVPAMAQFLSDQIDLHGAGDVSVYADSAGTILAMSAVRQLVLSGRPVPASMVLLSPAPDASLSNPDIRDIDDPVIDIDNLDFYNSGTHWADGFTDPKDPMLSPLFIEDSVLAGFPPTTIYIGTLEIGLPDTLLLHEKWNAAGGTASVVLGRGQIHDWALGGSINSQASKVRPDIYRQLGLNDAGDGPSTITTAPPSAYDQFIIWGLRTLRWLTTVTEFELGGVVGAVVSQDPPASAVSGLTVTERDFNGWKVWELASKRPSGEYVVALHGGGMVAEANLLHWSDYASMVRDTGATVLVPVYPLAPPIDTGTATTLVPPMADYLSMLIDEHGVDNVSLYGDSSGGSFAVLAVQEMLRRCRSDAQCVISDARPSRMVLVSPALHLTLTGPEVDAIDDPVLPNWGPGEGPRFNGELDVDDPRVNPISGADLTGLPQTAVYIGTVERLYPGALAFRDKLLGQDPDADFTVVIGDGQIHGWALGGIAISSQSPTWRPTVYRQLGLLT